MKYEQYDIVQRGAIIGNVRKIEEIYQLELNTKQGPIIKEYKKLSTLKKKLPINCILEQY